MTRWRGILAGRLRATHPVLRKTHQAPILGQSDDTYERQVRRQHTDFLKTARERERTSNYSVNESLGVSPTPPRSFRGAVRVMALDFTDASLTSQYAESINRLRSRTLS